MRGVLYFFLAIIPAILAGAKETNTQYEWGIVGLNALYQGLLALKAWQSNPSETHEDTSTQRTGPNLKTH